MMLCFRAPGLFPVKRGKDVLGDESDIVAEMAVQIVKDSGQKLLGPPPGGIRLEGGGRHAAACMKSCSFVSWSGTAGDPSASLVGIRW